ncbi:MAG TPA: hypothetical protein VGM41_16235 [Chitinophagaceae bacterium]
MLLLLMILTGTVGALAQKSKWTNNFGIEFGSDFYTGTAGMSTLKSAENPLVHSDLQRKYAAEAGFYAEFLQLRQRNETQWGKTLPGFGIKTGLNWQFFRADNSNSGGGEAAGLNYAVVPLLFEYCVGYHQGVTRASYTPGTTTYNGRRNPDGSVTVTENSTNGTYSPGGAKTSTGTLLYAGPQMCYLFKSFNYTGDPIKNSNLNINYAAFICGITFWTHEVSFDFSYQKGLTSIYKGKNITVDGLLLKLGINFRRRLYN